MRVAIAAVSGLVVGALAAGSWFWRDNQALEDRARRAEAASASATEEAAPLEGDAPRQRAREGGGDGTRLLGAIGRALQAGGDAPEARTGSPRSEDWQARRERRQQRLRETLGRREGESDEAYRERVVPMVQTLLMVPRGRVAERRREFEDAAGVSDEQRAKFDSVLKDTQSELIALANQAVAAGQLTPYRRNSAGIAGFVGGAATIAEGADQRLRQIFTKEQLAEMDQSGLDLVEYLALTTPWETVNPPPADPN